MGKVDDIEQGVADLHAELPRFLVRELEESFQQAQLVHQFQGGRVDGVAAEIAQEVLVFLQHQYRYAGPGQQKAQHQAGGTAAAGAAADFDGSHGLA
nr:hypothetical protein [Nevskia soli]